MGPTILKEKTTATELSNSADTVCLRVLSANTDLLEQDIWRLLEGSDLSI